MHCKSLYLCLNFAFVEYPMITTLTPGTAIQTFSSSASIFTLPLGYSGTVVICTGFGWPPPFIEWQKNRVSLHSNGGVVSEMTQMEDSAFMSAKLKWNRAFADIDVGAYDCVIRGSNETTTTSQSKTITLVPRDDPLPTLPPPPTCSINSPMVLFEVRVQDTDCSVWTDNQQTLIANNFVEVVMSVVLTGCQTCNITTVDVTLQSGPTCSNNLTRAVVFRGVITSEIMNLAEEAFCALSIWQQRGPIVRLNGNFYLVDRMCSAQLESLTDTECINNDSKTGNDTSDTFPIIIAVPVGVVAAAVLAVCVVLAMVVLCWIKGKSAPSTVDQIEMSQNPLYGHSTEEDVKLQTNAMYGLQGEEGITMQANAVYGVGSHDHAQQQQDDTYETIPDAVHVAGDPQGEYLQVL